MYVCNTSLQFSFLNVRLNPYNFYQLCWESLSKRTTLIFQLVHLLCPPSLLLGTLHLFHFIVFLLFQGGNIPLERGIRYILDLIITLPSFIGPTSFAPVIDAAIDIVERNNGQYHVLVIIADGQVFSIFPPLFYFHGMIELFYPTSLFVFSGNQKSRCTVWKA